MSTATKGGEVGKKRASKPEDDKRYGTQIRVSLKFARSIVDAAHFERMSVAEFADEFLFPMTEKRYRESVIREARRMEGKG
jgi:hypothetical protein